MNNQVWEKVLSKGETLEYEFSISDKSIKGSLIGSIIIGIPLLFLWGLGIIVIAMGIFTFFTAKKFNNYALTNKRILIHSGWIATKLTSVDYNKITDISVTESAVTHLGKIFINTAGSMGHEIILKNIQNPYEIKKKIDELKN